MKFGWASSLRQRLRFTPLHLALIGADLLARVWPTRWRTRAAGSFKPGVSVLIPERGTPDLLAECLAAADTALRRIDEPYEVIVVVNGAQDWPADELWERQAALTEHIFSSADAREGSAAFAEKRRPVWQGK